MTLWKRPLANSKAAQLIYPLQVYSRALTDFVLQIPIRRLTAGSNGNV